MPEMSEAQYRRLRQRVAGLTGGYARGYRLGLHAAYMGELLQPGAVEGNPYAQAGIPGWLCRP